MQAIRGYFDGTTVVPIGYVNWKKDQKVLITLVEDSMETKSKVRHLGKITDDNYEILLEALKRGEEVEYEYDDPFFSLENIKRLNQSIINLDVYGKGSFHDIIEVEDDE